MGGTNPNPGPEGAGGRARHQHAIAGQLRPFDTIAEHQHAIVVPPSPPEQSAGTFYRKVTSTPGDGHSRRGSGY